ncbi:hypothetical protein [Paractinoplanes durhamensis]|nr:hypothetical protein [Actinoplanes durhamensis]
MAVVRREHVTKTFPGGTTAVDDLSPTIGDAHDTAVVPVASAA